jgi:hypothetical protein
LAEQMARRPGSGSLGESIDRTLEDVGRARTEQLSELNGDDEGSPSSPGSPDEGQGQGQGQGSPDESPGSSEGEGPPQMGLLGPPSGKPGPGGGEGSADSTPGALPQASLAAPEHVDVDPSGAPQGAIRVIRRFTQGQRDDREYQAVHGEYNAIAESAVRREEIPLTRRDYIRNYFQAVRGN